MRCNLKRTHATSLTDDELIFLDVMFDGAAPFRMLRQSMFMDYWNSDPHSLDDCQLRDTIDRFCEGGVLEPDPFGYQNQTYYGLTRHGGALWESERTPVWKRYVLNSYRAMPSGKQMVSILAVSADVRDDYWCTGCDLGMWSSNIARVRFWRIANHTLIPWKRFPHIYVAVAIVNQDQEEPNTAWMLYEARRTWWQNVSELQKFIKSDTL